MHRKIIENKTKLILIHFTSYVEYVFFFFFVVQNVVGKIDKRDFTDRIWDRSYLLVKKK